MEVINLKNGRLLPPHDCKEMQLAYTTYRAAQNKLAIRAKDLAQLRYHVRPKIHQLGHCIFHFLPRNPRYMSCYADEDFVARTKRIAERTHPVYMSRLVLYRYCLGMTLKWRQG